MHVVYRKNFDKKFKKLPEKIKNQFYSRIAIFIADPLDTRLNNHSVEKVFPSCRSINITGDYRAIFYEEDDVVFFIMIGTHSELY